LVSEGPSHGDDAHEIHGGVEGYFLDHSKEAGTGENKAHARKANPNTLLPNGGGGPIITCEELGLGLGLVSKRRPGGLIITCEEPHDFEDPQYPHGPEKP